MSRPEDTPPRSKFVRHLLTAAGAGALTLACFLILPVIQAITPDDEPDMELADFDNVALEPPPPPPEPEEPEDEPPPEPEQPEPPQQLNLLDLSQLEMALQPNLGGSWMGEGFATQDLAKLVADSTRGGNGNGLGLGMNQEPRVKSQVSPSMSAAVRAKAPGAVWVRFLVDEQGRVQRPEAESADDPVFIKPALAALQKWTFEPAKQDGKPVAWPMKVRIHFPKN